MILFYNNNFCLHKFQILHTQILDLNRLQIICKSLYIYIQTYQPNFVT